MKYCTEAIPRLLFTTGHFFKEVKLPNRANLARAECAKNSQLKYSRDKINVRRGKNNEESQKKEAPLRGSSKKRKINDWLVEKRNPAVTTSNVIRR